MFPCPRRTKAKGKTGHRPPSTSLKLLKKKKRKKRPSMKGFVPCPVGLGVKVGRRKVERKKHSRGGKKKKEGGILP